MSGTGLISLLSGEKPETIAPGLTGDGQRPRRDCRRGGGALRGRQGVPAGERLAANFTFEGFDRIELRHFTPSRPAREPGQGDGTA